MLTNEKVIMTVQDLAKDMQISLPIAYELVHRADFPKIRVGRCIRIPRDAYKDWLIKQATMNN